MSNDDELDLITQILVPTALSLITIVGLLGNGIVILVVFLNKNLQTITNVYLLNLAIADFLLVAQLPIWAVTYRNSFSWKFSNTTCKFSRCILKQNLFASVGLLTALSVDRALAVAFAKSRARHITHGGGGSTRSRRFKRFTFPITCDLNSINVTIVLVWIASFVLALPEVIFSENYFIRNQTYCLFKLPIDDEESYFKFMGLYQLWIVLATFFFPVIILIICYSLIISTVKQKLIGNTDKKRRAIKLAVTVVVAFFLCFLPNNVIAIHSVLFQWFKVGHISDEHVKFVHNLKSFAVCLAFFNSALNPLIYAFSVRNFQQSCIKLFRLEKYFDATPGSSPSHAPLGKAKLKKSKSSASKTSTSAVSKCKISKSGHISKGGVKNSKYFTYFRRKSNPEKSESIMDYNIDAIISERKQLDGVNKFYKWDSHLPEGVRLNEIENEHSSTSVMTQGTYVTSNFKSRGSKPTSSFWDHSSAIENSSMLVPDFVPDLVRDRSLVLDVERVYPLDPSSAIDTDENENEN